MHNCGHVDLYKKDVAKVLDRWSVDPEYAVFMNGLYQEMLKSIEDFSAKQGKSRGDDTSNRKSAKLLAGFLTHMKKEARRYLDKNSRGKSAPTKKRAPAKKKRT